MVRPMKIYNPIDFIIPNPLARVDENVHTIIAKLEIQPQRRKSRGSEEENDLEHPIIT